MRYCGSSSSSRVKVSFSLTRFKPASSSSLFSWPHIISLGLYIIAMMGNVMRVCVYRRYITFIRVCERFSLMVFECDTAQFNRPTNRALSDGHKTALHLLVQLIFIRFPSSSFSSSLLIFNACKCNLKNNLRGVYIVK